MALLYLKSLYKIAVGFSCVVVHIFIKDKTDNWNKQSKPQ